MAGTTASCPLWRDTRTLPDRPLAMRRAMHCTTGAITMFCPFCQLNVSRTFSASDRADGCVQNFAKQLACQAQFTGAGVMATRTSAPCSISRFNCTFIAAIPPLTHTKMRLAFRPIDTRRLSFLTIGIALTLPQPSFFVEL